MTLGLRRTTDPDYPSTPALSFELAQLAESRLGQADSRARRPVGAENPATSRYLQVFVDDPAEAIASWVSVLRPGVVGVSCPRTATLIATRGGREIAS